MRIQPERLIVESHASLAHTAAAWIAESMADAIHRRGTCAIGLSGGSTPRAVYEQLATSFSDVSWDSVHVYFGDERAVPPTDPASNFRMAHEALLGRVALPAVNVHRMEGERADLDAAARDYDRQLPPALDLLMLGIGPDGHTASLFPGAPALDERTRRVLASNSPFPPTRRLTITPPVIAAARRVVVIAAGRDKADIVHRALEGPVEPHALPVQLALRGTWMLDHEAAARLARVPA